MSAIVMVGAAAGVGVVGDRVGEERNGRIILDGWRGGGRETWLGWRVREGGREGGCCVVDALDVLAGGRALN